jgi:hypothetical protein
MEMRHRITRESSLLSIELCSCPVVSGSEGPCQGEWKGFSNCSLLHTHSSPEPTSQSGSRLNTHKHACSLVSLPKVDR